MKLIVGLGNPEAAYAMTRHNLGFMVVESLAKKEGVAWRKSAVAKGLATKVVIEKQDCSLLLPSTYMNNSGVAVHAAMTKMNIDPADVLIVYDDMAIPFEVMRVRPDGGAAGHNGIKSIIEHLGHSTFPRLRLGVGRPRPGIDAADYVLANFTAGEQKRLPAFINEASLCVHSWVTGGVEHAMNQFNKRKTANE